MPQYSTPPPPLESAIESSAARYHIPVDILTGIWRIESASSYPNPYVNSLGYGGLFGTTKAYAPTQEQADYAASILQNLIIKDKSLERALSDYSGGGYTQVPGENVAADHAAILSWLYTNPTPTYGTSQTTIDAKTGATTTQNAPPLLSGGLFGWVGNALSDIEKAFLRGAIILLGGAVVIVGLYLIARSFGVPVPAPMPAVKALPGRMRERRLRADMRDAGIEGRSRRVRERKQYVTLEGDKPRAKPKPKLNPATEDIPF